MNFTQDLACASASQRRIFLAWLFLCGASQKTNAQVKPRLAVLSWCHLTLHPRSHDVLLLPTTQLQNLPVWNMKLLGQPFFAHLFLHNPSIWEGMKACSLPPPQNISNFHLSSLGITCLTGAGVQAVLICPFAKTLSKQSASYLLCEEKKKWPYCASRSCHRSSFHSPHNQLHLQSKRQHIFH